MRPENKYWSSAAFTCLAQIGLMRWGLKTRGCCPGGWTLKLYDGTGANTSLDVDKKSQTSQRTCPRSSITGGDVPEPSRSIEMWRMWRGS